jgi:O-6-methylguanine DNA methyltransferase
MISCVSFNGVPLTVYSEGGIVVKIAFGKCKKGSADREMENALVAFWNGNENALKYTFQDVSVNLKLVFKKVQQIPRGKVASYGDVSRAVFGTVKYSRFVGQAMKRNPLPIIVPCHRVIKSDGTLGGFGGTVPLKKKLLKIEGVKIKNGKIPTSYFARL